MAAMLVGQLKLFHRVKGCKGGAVMRALASYQCGPGSNPDVDAICGLSLLLVLSPAPRGFSPGTPVLPSPQKPTFPNSNSTRNQVDEEPLCGWATYKSLFIYLFTWKTGDSKCLEVGGQLWKSRQLWQLRGCKAPEARGVWVASYLKSSSQWNSSSHRLVLKPLWKWSLVPREQKWFCS